MTTRNATSYLSRIERVGERRWTDLAMVLAFGAIQWPWLAIGLWGGRKRDKARLLARLGLPGDALPHLGSWKADTGLLHLLVDMIERTRPGHVVELGSGASTLVLAKALALHGGGRLTSFDQHGDFVDAVRSWLAEHGLSADLQTAPLGPPPEPWPRCWYRLDHVPDTIDLLVVDGPHWAIHPFVRGAAETLFDRIAPGGSVVLDDAARPGERVVAARWKRRWTMFDWSYRSGIKGTLIGRRASADQP